MDQYNYIGHQRIKEIITAVKPQCGSFSRIHQGQDQGSVNPQARVAEFCFNEPVQFLIHKICDWFSVYVHLLHAYSKQYLKLSSSIVVTNTHCMRIA